MANPMNDKLTTEERIEEILDAYVLGILREGLLDEDEIAASRYKNVEFYYEDINEAKSDLLALINEERLDELKPIKAINDGIYAETYGELDAQEKIETLVNKRIQTLSQGEKT